MASNVGLQPLTSMQRSIFSVATSLTSADTALPNWLTVNPKRALANGLAVISRTSSSVNTLTAIIFGFGSLGTGFYLYIWRNAPLRAAFHWLSSRFVGSVSIASSHPLNKDVLTYLESKRLGPQANSLALVNPNAGPTMSDMLRGVYDLRPIQPAPRSGHKYIELEPEKLEYVPVSGSYVFWHGGHRMTLTRNEEVTGFYQDDGKFVRTQNGPSDLSRGQTLTITCWSLGGGVQHVKEFLEHVREATKPAKQNTTTIFRASCHKEQQKFHWDVGVNRAARTVDSIALESGKKHCLMKECTRYFSPEDERFHALRGIPYRRGLLFYGPPGTGKTSFTVALAGHFKLNVYMISMSDDALNDRGLGLLFDTLPRRCIVLLEDIDSSGIEREPRKEKITSLRDPSKVKRTVLVGVTLAGLLNVLDGPASVDGRLVVMTSNSPDALDAALLRPGRIDSKILFGYTTKEVSGQIFSHIFNRTADEIVHGDEEQTKYPSPEELVAMAEQFATCIPETKISPAECQGYLMRHRDDPHAALSNAEAWAADILAVKEKGKNVADFDNEIKRGGALFAGRGNRLPPNEMHPPDVTEYVTRSGPLGPGPMAKLRVDARALMEQRGYNHAHTNGEVEGYDSGAEEEMDMPPLRTMVSMPPGDYTNGNGAGDMDPFGEEGLTGEP
jgi:chaperone BCS1